jgi:hypothetical protein
LGFVLGFGRGTRNPMKRLPVRRDEPPARPITLRAAEDLGPFELAQLWCDRTAWPIDERTQSDELSELAVMSALASWLRRWQPRQVLPVPEGNVLPFTKHPPGPRTGERRRHLSLVSAPSTRALPGMSRDDRARRFSEAGRSNATSCARLVSCHHATGSRRDRPQRMRRQWSGSDRSVSWSLVRR